MKLRLTPRAKTALWTGGGALLGLAFGALLVNPGRAVGFAPVWSLVTFLYLGAVAALGRAPSVPRASVPVQRLVPTGTQDFHIAVSFPDVPEGYPAVMGRAEPLRVGLLVLKGPSHAAGAAVRLKATLGAETLQGEGVTGSDGTLDFTLEPSGTGELAIHAEALLEGARADARTTVSIVQYEDEITRLFHEFRAYATSLIGPDAHADTAREIAERLRPRAGPDVTRALLELARIYELVAYGEREADRRLYLAVLAQLLVLENAEIPASAAAASPRGA